MGDDRQVNKNRRRGRRQPALNLEDSARPEGLSESEDPRNPPGFTDAVYGMLFQPAVTIRLLAAQPPLGLSILIFAISSFVGSWASLYSFSASPPAGLPFDPGDLGFAFIPVLLMINGFSWVVLSGLYHLVAQLLGGRGRFPDLFILLGPAHLPEVLLAPFALASVFLGAWLWSLAVFGVSIWTLALSVLVVREVEGLTTGRSAAAVLLPGVVLVGLLVVLVVFLGILLSFTFLSP